MRPVVTGSDSVIAATTSLHFGNIELRSAERRVLVSGQPVGLGARAFDLLTALVNKRERVVSKDELLDEVWPGLVVEENNLQVQISGLRRVLGAAAITTVPGFGYRFTLVPDPHESPDVQDVPGTAKRNERRASPPQPQPPVSGASQAPSARLAAARLLVADDNRVNRLLLCRSLELMGHHVSSAANGVQALALLRQEPFDLLLLDLAMPELDGFGVLQQRADDAALSEVAVIVTSAMGGVAPVARCIELGADDFLHKPVDPWLLKARVESSLLRKQQRDLQRVATASANGGAPMQLGWREDVCVLVAQVRLPDPSEGATQDTAQDSLELLNNWCTLMIDGVEGAGGQVAQFTGDSLLALFDNPGAAAQAERDMTDVMRLFNEERSALGQAPITTGIGTARGAILVGQVGSTHLRANTCVGAPVQRAQQLAAAKTAVSDLGETM